MKRLTQKLRSVFAARATVLKGGFCAAFFMATGFFTLQSNLAYAQPCNDVGGRVVSMEGAFTVAGNLTQMGEPICSGDEIMIGQGSRGAIRLASSQTVVRVNQNSTFVIEASGTDGSLLKLFKGVLYLFSRRPVSFSVETPYVNAAIDGTEFVIESSAESSKITVIEGSVSVSNAQGRVRVMPGEVANAGPNEAPRRRAVIDPVNAVQWALYYPPIGAAENTSAAVRSAAELLARGDVEKAEALLVASPEDAASLALKAIIAVTRNQSADAMQLSQRAVSADADSSLAYSALSYAQQAVFDIDQALASARQAVRNDPGNADALARQAELQLGVDETADALLSAREAVRVDPTNSRARTILGFVHLVRLDVGKAQETFSEAVDLDPGDPLPRLGLGLAVIRDGRLREGREHIEVAASLDPADALVRSYLGKAYFEERQTGDASAQFELAKGLDPQDPTAWFYDALLDQALNRPVSAYEKINRARELNDNRLIYQSRLLVDKSAAAGQLSLANIYTDLGFEQLAINESTRSIATDPANHSAYRLLADSYSDRVRHESARRNVMFQASMLQPMTIIPIQPNARESDLLILPSLNPVHPTINEYSPLFDRQGFQLAGSLVAGNRQSLGNNIVLSGLHDRFAYSFGQFHYQTDGFRANNDIEHDIYNGFLQVQLRQNLFFQAEHQEQQSARGDLTQNSNLNDFNADLRIEIESTSPRIGLRWELGPRSTILISGRAIDRTFDSTTPSGDSNFVISQETSGTEASARVNYSIANSNQVIGIDSYELNLETAIEFQPCDEEPCTFGQGATDSAFENFYYYLDLHSSQRLEWTFGLSYTDFDDEQLKVMDRNLDPKLGVRWSPTDSDEFRLAVSRGTKRRNVADQTLEPTALAGFNQIFDDFTGTRYINTGLAYDRKISSSTSAGLQLFHRQLDILKLRESDADGSLESVDESQTEATFRGYWNRILHSALTLDLAFLYERFERDDSRSPDGSPITTPPLFIETVSLPIGIHYTHSSGIFARSEISSVLQRVERYSDPDAGADTSFIYDEISEHFTNVNVSVGFNFPGRRTTLRLDINNLFDEPHRFQGHNIQSDDISSPRYSPEQLIVARVSFLFR